MLIACSLMGYQVKEGVFDSFSESNSREGSLRAGSALGKPPPAIARLLACREEAPPLGSTHASGLPHTALSCKASNDHRTQRRCVSWVLRQHDDCVACY